MFNRLRFTPARRHDSRAGRANLAFADVAAGAVGSLIADGVGGGQQAPKQAKGKSRRWRDGGSRRDKAVTQPYRVTAWCRMRCGSDGAGLARTFASAVTERSVRLRRSPSRSPGCVQSRQQVIGRALVALDDRPYRVGVGLQALERRPPHPRALGPSGVDEALREDRQAVPAALRQRSVGVYDQQRESVFLQERPH